MTFTTKRIDRGLDEIQKRFKLLSMRKSYVRAGFFGSKTRSDTDLTNAQLASIHEFGLGNVPARPFMRPAFELHKDEYLAMLRKAYEKAVLKNNPRLFEATLKAIGMKMAADIKNFVTAGAPIPPPLAPKTVQRKGSSRPLVDTGELVGSIDSEVVL